MTSDEIMANENMARDFSPLCVHVQLLQSCPTLRNPMECSPPDSSVHGHSSGKKAGVGCHTLLQGSS